MTNAVPASVQRRYRIAVVLALGVLPLAGATMVRLSLDDMIVKSTAIVRGTVSDSGTAVAGPVIFTHYHIQVTEQLKGSGAGVVELAVPGGVANGVRQSFSGTPRFQPGEEYVFFLWTSKARLTQVIGLTQGLFRVAASSGGDSVATRDSSHELMLDAQSHHAVKDQTWVMPLSDLRARIAARLKAGK